MKEIIINSNYDNLKLNLNVYEVQNPVAVVQVIHGMMEHQLRYQELATKLNSIGLTVITSDLRGHGHKTTDEDLGYMGDKKPWEALISDQLTITKHIKDNYPNLPIYLFGHSMGTIITRNLLQKNDNLYQKVILSGAPCNQPLAKIGIIVANIIGLFKGQRYKSKLLENMTLGPFNKSIKNPKTSSDWLSYNEINVFNYSEDKYCGFPFTVSAYKALYHLLCSMSKRKKYQVLNKNLPILMIVGKDDPCTGGVKGVKGSLKLLYNLGYNISAQSYDDMRHEILNEKNPEYVYNDIIHFFQS